MVGFTGPPGAGKSTLARRPPPPAAAPAGPSAVLSIDPSCPFTEGALLGDRIRLTEHFLDPGVFIRSMASRGALGGLSRGAAAGRPLLAAAGRELVSVETVGTGQAEVAVRDLVDTVVLVLMPGSGDSVQSIKAGVMEIPDLIAVNKADNPLTDTMIREIRSVPPLAGQPSTASQRALAGSDREHGSHPRTRGLEESVEKLNSTASTSRAARRARSAAAAGTCATRCWRSSTSSAPCRARRRSWRGLPFPRTCSRRCWPGGSVGPGRASVPPALLEWQYDPKPAR